MGFHVSKQEPKGKEKLFGGEPIIDNSEDEEELDENELKNRKAREVELDKHQRIIREADEKKELKRRPKALFKAKKLLFPKWTMKRIYNDVVNLSSQYWLELIVSFDLQNTQDSQFDLPIAPKAFRFHAFIKVDKHSNHGERG